MYQAVKQLCVGGERLEFLAAHQQSRNPEVAELFGFFTIKVGEIDLRLHENHIDMRNFGNKNGHSRFHINAQFSSSLRTFYSIFAGVWLKWVQPLGAQNNGDMSKTSKRL